tara:strand:- start:61 stop:1275 length:1215 start_codon:yes stop_codon:yes gene_type:complete
MPYIGTAPSSELANLDINGQKFILDADADTSITADTDDTIDIEIAGADDFQFTANTFTAKSGSTIAAQALTGTTGIFSSDVTGLTLNATGDTAAADNAAIGYTSAEGLILTGQGSTNDITIKNDADADVITIATGGTVTGFAGGVTIAAGNFQYITTDTSLYNNGSGGNAGIRFDSALASGNTPMEIAGANSACAVLNRMTGDGAILTFMQDGSEEGSISVSGSTVSYNAFAGSHPAQWVGEQETPARGSVISSANVLAEWRQENLYDAATDKHLKVLDGRTTKELGTRVDNPDATPPTYTLVEPYNNIRLPKVKLSDESGDKSVYGVFDRIDQETNNVMVMALGAFVSLVTGACASGDLLESNGDGTAKVQSDDVIRSSTLGKVTVGKGDVAVGLVPCVLYCG